ncbi:RNA polymerase sigma-70 factor, sigma-E family [Actinacidiphila yanglinensis]|uniref:RNA polymerase sigma-70 factor, sigma-E family n=1 Tax=Actinacidiphila yanglinensis TaxID=310779 RepID=A0A1H5U0H4_9ACTN|nr:RNA polymerase sigma-70 factor, sigma-E family [Actinacidiphila yanglinensis]
MSVGNGAGSTADDEAAAFHEFFEQHYAELARLAHLLTGEADAADDLAADALVALWRHWDRVRVADHPAAYARGVVANLARSRIRSAVRERRRIALFWSQRTERAVEQPDVPAVLDLREALQRLPFRKRACVVLRHAFDLSEKDTAEALGISVGTVKSQTSRGVAELERLLAHPAAASTGASAVPAPPVTAVARSGPALNSIAGATSSVPTPGAPPGSAAVPAVASAVGDPLTAARAGHDPEPALGPATAALGSMLAEQPPSAGGTLGPAEDGAAGTTLLAEQTPPAAGGLQALGGQDAGGAGKRHARSGESAAASGSAPAAEADAERSGAARILESTDSTTRPRTRTGRGM